MLELGDTSEQLHSDCGEFAAARRLDMVIGIQGAAREIVRAAVSGGIPEERARFFPDSGAAAEFIEKRLAPGDLLLVKGSRGVHTEKIVQRLRSHFDLSGTLI
jgi:UDP-N-acetylmuramoyl-tripeptide--D-alanyl-D-alanine ligase